MAALSGAERAALAALKTLREWAAEERCSYYGTPARTVAEEAGMTREAASAALKKLERKGLVRKVVTKVETPGRGGTRAMVPTAFWAASKEAREMV